MTVQFQRYPDSVHQRFETRRLGEDRHGVWLAGVAGTTGLPEPDPRSPTGSAFVMLIPPRGWWTMMVDSDPERPEITVGVCTTPRWTRPDLVEMIDLHLTVVRRRDDSVGILNEESFEQHRGLHPEGVASRARVTAVELMLAVEQRRPPFDGTAAAWLGGVIESA